MLSTQLESIFEPILADLGYELLLVEIKGGGEDCLLRVYIDGPNGIGLGDCEAASREMSAAMDVADVIAEAYTLEVSSPGLDRPLTKRVHFEQFTGQTVRIQMRQAVDGRRRFRGVITGLDNDNVCLEVDGAAVALPFELIEKARLVPDFNSIN